MEVSNFSDNLYNLETLFTEATKRHPELHYLDAQWKFDKELLSKSLQHIGSFFSHYSRHDASHSRKLITNIERILGERLMHLSATDMWLILEAAYSHDIGMVITEKQLSDLDESDFEQFLNELAEDENSEHQETALKLLNSDFKLGWKKSCWHEIEKFKFIIAEWFRKKHPYNSANIVLNPNDEIGLTSPRNELLPRRLFLILSKICAAHGQSFEEVMELSRIETGMATENCHPRFVACLIRMADLLDIDDNRFCPVMMKATVGGLPHSSQIHNKKHNSINTFRLDSHKIEIKLECPDVETFEITRDWFDWLEEEHLNQSRNWNDIVPNEKHGSLPILAKTVINIIKPNLLLNRYSANRFKLDSKRMNELLTSEGFYRDKYDSAIRELMQNAFDATIKRIWHEHKVEYDETDPSSLLNKYSHQYPIMINLIEHPDYIELIIQDSGIGLTLNDLKSIFDPGNIECKKEKMQFINSIDGAFRPSGYFGIGLRSYFMLSDTIKLTSKCALTNEQFETFLCINNKGNSVLERTDIQFYGTKVTLQIKKDDNHNDFHLMRLLKKSKNLELKKRRVNSRLNFDPIEANTDTFSNTEFFILHSLGQVIEQTLFNITIKCKTYTQTITENYSNPNIFYSPKNGVSLLKFRIKSPYEIELNSSDFAIFFKGQFITNNSPFFGLNCTELEANILTGQAGDFLCFNREKILKKTESKVMNRIHKTLVEYIECKFDNFSDDEPAQPTDERIVNNSEKKIAAAFYFLLSDNKNLQKNSSIPQEIKQILMNYSITKEKKLGDIISDINKGKIKSVINNAWQLNPYRVSNDDITDEFNKINDYIKEKQNFCLAVHSIFCSKILIECIRNKNLDEKVYFLENSIFDKSSNFDIHTLQFIDKKSEFPFTEKFIADSFKLKNKNNYYGKRKLFPATGIFEKLAIALPPTMYFDALVHSKMWETQLILPYKFSLIGDEIRFEKDTSPEFINWVFKHRIDKSVTEIMIKELIEDLEKKLSPIFHSSK
ncbi:HD domain-containing protein [Thorsellia anophelis]|uniref:Histidine kinase-, DNA gyrase B-, and HSP90-like ATPase n=1 Tax=Thorsellia anophelis DSM 18579 TaxID=1123402 RepID=A0A1I0CD96_9GAMM|nr:ATP-binding protein [Thorsellia anophelis]SET17530.1 Histidine kinase-, DNA gyrase B-, and HSP90-like ATPase [Thorsellia anophelis DSM 18579]